MKHFIFGILTLLMAKSALAAVSPYYRSVKEIKAILESNDVARQLNPSKISSVTRTETGYLVTAGECTVAVQITYVSPPLPDFPGPGQLELHVGQALCLPEQD